MVIDVHGILSVVGSVAVFIGIIAIFAVGIKNTNGKKKDGGGNNSNTTNTSGN